MSNLIEKFFIFLILICLPESAPASDFGTAGFKTIVTNYHHELEKLQQDDNQKCLKNSDGTQYHDLVTDKCLPCAHIENSHKIYILCPEYAHVKLQKKLEMMIRESENRTRELQKRLECMVKTNHESYYDEEKDECISCEHCEDDNDDAECQQTCQGYLMEKAIKELQSMESETRISVQETESKLANLLWMQIVLIFAAVLSCISTLAFIMFCIKVKALSKSVKGENDRRHEVPMGNRSRSTSNTYLTGRSDPLLIQPPSVDETRRTTENTSERTFGDPIITNPERDSDNMSNYSGDNNSNFFPDSREVFLNRVNDLLVID